MHFSSASKGMEKRSLSPRDVTAEESSFVVPYLTLMKEEAPQRQYKLTLARKFGKAWLPSARHQCSLAMTLRDHSRAWKSFDWGALNRFDERGLIGDPVNKTNP
ncbi:hypothetical protein BamMEX5DRAFT_6322 [Burkholderia ambifaria MEX-5]|uniref:DUF6429 domain-containing protein n=1 Tax=Burkholderia ambifaria MEX-5 TaxID=396597 RepID=B1TEV6_9BURK|nr:hypothetical protein BamMEX5DRAFT_6322 [Burkholderia ambifaria MEX-5]